MEKQPSRKASFSYIAAYLAIKSAIRLSGNNLTASGLDNLPDEDSFILAYTHHNSWDVPALGTVIYEKIRRPVYFMAKKELLDKTVIGQLLKSMHALPVNRSDKADISQIRRPIEVLRNGNIIGIAPEGGRVDGDKVAKLQAGVGTIAIRANAKIVPVGIAGKNKLKNQQKKPFMPRSLHIHFGEPLSPDELSRKDIDKRLRPKLQSALNESYKQYAGLYGMEEASKLDRGLTKLF